jgi:hypothetical protein
VPRRFIPVREVAREHSRTEEDAIKADCGRKGRSVILTLDGKRYAVNRAARTEHPELPYYRTLKDDAVNGLVPILCPVVK